MDGDLGANIARWMGRILGILQILLFMILFIADMMSKPSVPTGFLDILILLAVVGAVVGMIYAWVSERKGAVIVLAGAALMAVLGFARSGSPMMLFVALFPAFVGGLHLLSSQLRDPNIVK